MITPEEAGRTGGHDEPPDELTKHTAMAIHCLFDASDDYQKMIQFVQIIEHHFNERRKERAWEKL